ncbi:MAG: hypothetical protein U9N14_04345 [Pseudomonadota bacterium]|nr:hypothetical protein [Pseudomonadota bacterium]
MEKNIGISKLDTRTRFAFAPELVGKIVDAPELMDRWTDRLIRLIEPDYDPDFMEHVARIGPVGQDETFYARMMRAETMAAEFAQILCLLLQEKMDEGRIAPLAYTAPASIEYLDVMINETKKGDQLSLHYTVGTILAEAARIHRIINTDFFPARLIENHFAALVEESIAAVDHIDAVLTGQLMVLLTDEAMDRGEREVAHEALDYPIKSKHLALHPGGAGVDRLTPERIAAKPLSPTEREISEEIAIIFIDQGYRYTPDEPEVTPRLVDPAWPHAHGVDEKRLEKSTSKRRRFTPSKPVSFKPKV